MMGLLSKRTGQSLIEYILIIVIATAAATSMSTYVFRAVQAKQKEITVESQKE